MGRRRNKNKGGEEGDAEGSAPRSGGGDYASEFNRPAEPVLAAHPTVPGCAVMAFGKRLVALDARCVGPAARPSHLLDDQQPRPGGCCGDG